MLKQRVSGATGIHELQREQLVDAPVDEAFAFFAQARNLERITPAWLRFDVLTAEPITMRTGAVIEYGLRLHGIPLRWTARIEDWQEGRTFVDRQVRGPYRLWHHRHEFESCRDGTMVRDHVHYMLPLWLLGGAAHALIVRRDLERIFDFRCAAVARELRSQSVTA
jgi:ligand-binding SRPBCC domain-containing protein